ncbi:hypothetical protein R1sor_014099 [Riccia sorocarpa]|uniref:Programmed cell death protein 5 n=1 Tax=Riccia sorocarpa TaxID=122646 RepID=A0ABD3HBM1_9MARC
MAEQDRLNRSYGIVFHFTSYRSRDSIRAKVCDWPRRSVFHEISPSFKTREHLRRSLRGSWRSHAHLIFADDPELAAIRQRRMQEMMKGAGGAGGSFPQNKEQQETQEEQRREAEERRELMLARVLTPEARERLSRIALVKPEKARGVEDLILRSAQYGQITEKVSEDRLISLLEQINEESQKKTTTVKFQRRRSVLDDDD